jgi:flagellar biosynthesis/type III secretory pathway chaperone
MSAVSSVDIKPHLQRILTEEARLLLQLEAVLSRETAILQREDIAAIQSIGGERQQYVEQLSQLDRERADICRMLSFGIGGAAMNKLFGWADPSAALQTQWRANLQIARRCKTLNDRNGAIVAVKLGRVQRLLGKLRGVAPPPIYGPKAARQGALGARNLGRA